MTDLETACLEALKRRSVADSEAPLKWTPTIFFIDQPEELERVRAANAKALAELEAARTESVQALDYALAAGPSEEFLTEAIAHLEEHGLRLCCHNEAHHGYRNPCAYKDKCFACISLEKIAERTGRP